MGWRENLRPASFRGVAFFVETEEYSGGRRTVTHEFPLNDDPYVEDMGRKGRTYSLDGYVIGDNYQVAKAALIAALEAEGPGALVLPYSGERKVACPSFRTRDDIKEGGMCRFSLDFEETPAQPLQPSAVTVSSIAVENTAATLLGDLSSSFVALFDVGDQPQFALDSLTQIMASATAAVDAAFSPIITTAQDLATFKAQVVALAASAEALVRAPSDLVIDVLAILGPIPGLDSAAAVNALLDVYDFDPVAVPPAALTPTRATEAANQALLVGLWRRAAIAQAAVAVVDVDFPSFDDAVAVRDRILDRLDTESETAPDEVFVSMQKLRAAVVVAVPGVDNELARLVKFTPPESVPSLVFAYGVYGDLKDELDVVARNHIRHPGFMPGGVELSVLGRD